MTWQTDSSELNSSSTCNLTVFYGRLGLAEETDGDRMTLGAEGKAQDIGYDQNDLAYDLLNEPVSSLDGRGIDYNANRNILPPKTTDIL